MCSGCTAHLYEQQIGAIAVPQACCELVLQSSTEQWGIRFAQTSAAEHWCWVTAHLYEQQIFIGAIAVPQACCELVLQSSTEAGGVFPITVGNAFCPVLQSIGVGSLHTCMSSKSS